VSVYESGQQQDAIKQAQKSQQQQAAREALLRKQEALTAAGPNAQSATGGSLTGPGNSDFISLLAGYGYGGGTQPGQAAVAATNAGQQPPAPSVSPDALSQFMQRQNQGGTFSGGWTPEQSAPPPNQFNLASFAA
jgi:hypothetical protein